MKTLLVNIAMIMLSIFLVSCASGTDANENSQSKTFSFEGDLSAQEEEIDYEDGYISSNIDFIQEVRTVSLRVDKDFIQENETYTIFTSQESKELKNSLEIQSKRNIFIVSEAKETLKAYILSDFGEINAYNIAISLLIAMVPSYIENTTPIIEALEKTYKEDIQILANAIGQSDSIDDDKVIIVLRELVSKIQDYDDSDIDRSLDETIKIPIDSLSRGFLDLDTNWYPETEKTSIPIKILQADDLGDGTQKISIEVYNKYGHWREFYITDKNGNKVKNISYPIAPMTATDRCNAYSSLSASHKLPAMLSDVFRGFSDDALSLLSEGITCSTKTTLSFTIPINSNELIISKDSQKAIAWNIIDSLTSILDMSELENDTINFFMDIANSDEDQKKIIHLWGNDQEELVAYLATKIVDFYRTKLTGDDVLKISARISSASEKIKSKAFMKVKLATTEASIAQKLRAIEDSKGYILVLQEEGQETEEANAAVKGTITNEDGQSLSGARVTLEGYPTSVTVRDGRYEFLEVPFGTYLLTIVKESYQPFSTTLNIQDNINRPIVLEEILVVEEIDDSAFAITVSKSSIDKGELVLFQLSRRNDFDSILWESDIDGELSKYETFTTTNLSVGSHAIKVTIVKNDQSVVMTLSIEVIDPNAYQLTASDDKLIDYFEAIALTDDYTAKWTRDMKIFIDGDTNSEILEELEKLKNEINALATDGFSVQIVDSKSNSNVHILMGTANEFKSLYQEDADFVGSDWLD